MFLTIGEGLRRHDRRMHDARPDGEGDQAAIRRRVPGGGDQEDTEHRIDAADHLEIVGALPAVPDPAGGPDYAERIDQQKDNPEHDEGHLQIFFLGLVVHDPSLVRFPALRRTIAASAEASQKALGCPMVSAVGAASR
ncbi:MAG: hypothetical protein WCD39_04735 [Methyloceanibacter sp.]